MSDKIYKRKSDAQKARKKGQYVYKVRDGYCIGTRGVKKKKKRKTNTLDTYQNGDFYVALRKLGYRRYIVSVSDDVGTESSTHSSPDAAAKMFERRCREVDRKARRRAK